MTPLEKAPELFGSLTKAFKFEGGSLILTAWAVSMPLTEFFETIFTDIPQKDIFMPFFMAGVSLLIYLTAYVIDFLYGIRASLHEGHGIQSNKLWSSIYKLMAIIQILLGMCFFAVAFLPLESSRVNTVFLWAIGIVGFAAFFFDVHSIGENYERRFGKKLKLFEWLDRMWEAINDTIIQRIKNLK